MKKQNRRTPGVIRIQDETICFTKRQLKRELRRAAKRTALYIECWTLGSPVLMQTILKTNE